MTSPTLHSRTQSSFSNASTPTSYRPSALNPNRDSRSESLRDTAYNGSEGLINDAEFEQDQELTPPARVATTPGRPAFGARFLSTLSNAQPAAAALTRKGSVLHSRAKSLAAYVPKLNTTANPQTQERVQRVQAPNRIFGDLFNGESAPIRLGPPVSPVKEKEEVEFVMEYTSALTERPSGLFRRRDTTESSRSTPTPQARKASWFTRRPTFTTPTKQQQDELSSLNINQSLFPNGPADPLNPASFNDLLLNATELLQRMQTAYKEKSEFISSMQPELDAQREEVEEAETRSKHLKMQLEDMGRKAQEQEQAMQDMAAQLAEEKLRVQELRENAARSVRLVRASTEDMQIHQHTRNEETPTRRRKRTSNDSASDSGFESDMESIFSANSGAETPISPPSISTASMPANDGHAWNLRQPKGRSDLPSMNRQGSETGKRMGSEGAAWATVEALRNENHDLKAQMQEMEKSLQGCIDFVGALNAV
jgi:hypothetical protein